MNYTVFCYSKIKTLFSKIDKISFFYVAFFLFMSLVLISSIDPAISNRIKIKEMTLLKKQFAFAIIGMFVIVSISMLEDTKILLNISIFFYIILYALMLYIIIFRREVKGSSRWIYIAGFSMQPSDIMKPFFLVLNAHILQCLKTKKKYTISLAFFLLTITPIILQPDIGTTILYFCVWFIVFFIAGASYKLISYISISTLVIAKIIYELIPNVQNRIKIFFMSRNGNIHYQIKKSIESITEGGLFGKGFGEGTVKYQLPDSYTDYIFSTMVEEFGLIFSLCIVNLFFFLFLRILLSKKIDYSFVDKTIVHSISYLFILQLIIHISVNLHLIPNKGMTFPLISYGGSSLISSSISFGIIMMCVKKKYSFSPLEKFI